MERCESSKAMIPASLQGRHGKLKPRWRKIVRKALTLGSWSPALEGESWVNVFDTHGVLKLAGPDTFTAADDDILLYLPCDLLATCSFELNPSDREASYQMQKRLVLDGFGSFWYALCLLSHSLWLPKKTSFECEMTDIGRQCLAAFVKYWSVFLALDKRFCRPSCPLGWPLWALNVQSLSAQAGMPHEQVSDLQRSPAAAGETLREFLSR